MSPAQLFNRLVEAAEHFGEIAQHEYTSDILLAADAVAALGNIVAKCEEDERQGYKSALRTYVIEIGRHALQLGDAEKSA